MPLIAKEDVGTPEFRRRIDALMADRIRTLPKARAEIWVAIAVRMGMNGWWSDEVRDAINDRFGDSQDEEGDECVGS